MENPLLQACSAFIIPNKPLYQPCFSYTEWAREDIKAPIIHVCGPCAHTCFGFDPNSEERHPSIDILDDTRELKKPFVCGCKGLRKTGHKCYWEKCDRSVVVNNREGEDVLVPLMENSWRRECRAFLEDLAYNGDVENAFDRKNAKEIEKLTKNLRRQHELFDQYFEEDTQNAARRCIPISKLVRRAKIAYENEKEGLTTTNGAEFNENNNKNEEEETTPYNIYQALADPSLHDHILKQLLYWFKHDFFKWVDQPLCEACGEKTFPYRPPKGTPGITRDNVVPTPEEKQNWASVIELYECKACAEQRGQVIRFPRYNKAKRLLTWRRGRCGEWTNCFALCCISLGFETRFVLDLTDHVWVEVYSTSRGRWVHLDPCENAFDAPLMYSKGWGKKLNYIFAISQSEIVDVTRRYTENPLALETRTRVSEMTLSFLVRGMNWFANKRCSSDRLPLLEQRANAEKEQLSQAGGALIQGEDLSGATSKGRQSGAVGWTVLRDESGGGGVGVGLSSVAGESAGNPLINQGLGKTSGLLNGLSTLDSVSTHAGNFFSTSSSRYHEFAEEATIQKDEKEPESVAFIRPKWIWKGGKKNVVKLVQENNNNNVNQEDWFAFRFASGCGGCNLTMIPPSSSSSSNGGGASASSSPICTLPSWTTNPSTSIPNVNPNYDYGTTSAFGQLLFPYPSRQIINSPRLPVPLSAERFTSIVDEFSTSLWFTPYFVPSSSSSKTDTTYRGIVGFSVGKTFRVDVSWEFSFSSAEEGKSEDSSIISGDFTAALSLRHVDLPTMSSELAKVQKNAKKWSENFSSVEPVSIWDANVKSNLHTGISTTTTTTQSSPSSSKKRRVNFRKVKLQEQQQQVEDETTKTIYVLDSQSALQLFSSLDKQGALTAIVYQRLNDDEEKNDDKNGNDDDESISASSYFRACSIAGSMVPVFLIDRGNVSMKVHGLETLVESVQVGW